MLQPNLAVDSEAIIHLAFPFQKAQREKFKAGKLGEQWAKRYPELFDHNDLGLYRNQSKRGFHFFEWLAAIIIYEATGYLSLVEKYGCAGHRRKLPLWENIAPACIQNLQCKNGWPDLFAISPDQKDWFFCETTGKDKLSAAQLECFTAIYAASGKKVYVFRFVERL